MSELPLAGVNVVELSLAIAAPSAGQVLSDFGAEVIKVEPPTGDTQRYMISGLGKALQDPYRDSPHFYHVNRGKRSVMLDLKSESGMAVLHALLSKADVFISNYRYPSIRALGLAAEDLLNRYPRLVICPMSGWGLEGPDAEKPSYDVAGFWARSGAASAHTSGDGYPAVLAPGFGDMATGLAAVGGVCAALVQRSRTGRGRVLTTSLLRAGMHCNTWSLSSYLAHDRVVRWGPRDKTGNPLGTCYKAKDGRAFWLIGFEADRHWPAMAKAVGKPEWIKDERFSSAPRRRKNEQELVKELDHLFAERTRAEWAAVFDSGGVWWAPVLDAAEAVADPQAKAAGSVIEVPMSERARQAGREHVRMVAPPVDFPGTDTGPRRPTPELGEHTEEVLQELDLTPSIVSDVLHLCNKQRSKL